jgi:hypothetical protein
MKFNEKMKKTLFLSYISHLRRPVEPSEYIVNKGISEFGTFSEPLKHINFLNCSKQGRIIIHN